MHVCHSEAGRPARVSDAASCQVCPAVVQQSGLGCSMEPGTWLLRMHQTAWLLVNTSGAAAGEGVSSNPLKQVLDAVEERVDCAVYDRVSPTVNTAYAAPGQPLTDASTQLFQCPIASHAV